MEDQEIAKSPDPLPSMESKIQSQISMNRFKGTSLRKIPVSEFFQMITVLSESQEYL